MASEFLEILSPGALEELKQVEALVKTLASDIKSINNFKSAGTPSGADKNIKSLTDAYDKQAESIKKVSLGLEKTTAIQKQIEQSAKNQTKATQTLTKEELSYTKAIERGLKAKERTAKAQAELSRAYVQLLAKQKEAKKELQDAIVLHGKNAKATKQAQREYDKYTAKVNQANKATSNFSKSGLGSAVRGFRNLLGAFGIYGGVMMFASLIKSIASTMVEMDKLNYTITNVIKNNGDLARTKLFLIDLTKKYGVELLDTTNRYVKFNIASRQAGLSLKETERIFSTVTEASALLGLKTDEVTGVYLALEQMLSKGKVTTEELRRQLGERLPGAFDLMAKALGKTTSELDKMLRAGEVISKDALPLLSEEIRDFYNLTGEGVDTLQTATGKLSSSWDLLIEAMDNSTGIGNLWGNILKGVASGLDDVREGMLGLEEVAKQNESNRYYKELTDNMDDTEEKYILLASATKEMSALEDEVYKKRQEIAKITKKSFLDYATGSAGVIKDISKEEEELGKLQGRYEALYNFKQKLILGEEEYRKSLLKRITAYKDEFGILEDRYDLAVLEGKSVSELEAAYKDLQKIQEERVKDTIPYYQNLIKANEEVLMTLKSTNKEDLKKADLIRKQNEEYQKQIDLIRGSSGDDKTIRETNIKSVLSFESEGSTGSEIDVMARMKTAIDMQIASVKELLEYTPKWSNEYDILTKKLEQLEKAFNGVDVTKANDEIQKNIDKEKEDEKALKSLKEELKSFRDQFATDFFSEAGFEFTGKFLMNFDEMSDMLDQSENKFADYFLVISEMAQEAYNFIAQASQQNFDAEYERVEKQKEIALQFAGESDAAKQRIEELAEARRKAIQRREAKAQKELAIINTTINTAQAIMQIWAHSPDASGISQGLLTAIIAGIGAAQVSVIASQKIPEFWKGTDNADSGLAWTQERGAEIITDKKGVVKDFGDSKGARLTMMEKGDKVYTADQTRKMMFNNELNGILSNNGISKSEHQINVVNNGLTKVDLDQVMSKHFSNIQTNQTVIDKNGLKTYVKNENSKTTLLNNRVSFKGFSV